MDNYLLTLFQHIPSGNVKVEDIAERLHLSTKQTRRKLRCWQEEGYLTFQPGRGRGNHSTLIWLREVEREFEEQFFKKLRGGFIEEVSKWLLLDWSAGTKQRMLSAFQAKFGFQQEGGPDRLIIPRFYPFLTFHPLKAADTNSAQLIANLYNRVVTLHADDTISPELAHTWEYQDTSLLLYIRKDVAFHDGSILTENDVVESFRRMKTDETYADLWKPITAITTPAPLVVKLEFPEGCTYVLQLLSLMPASIFKEENGRLLGTGSFCLSEETSGKTVLSAFKQYYGERPLLDRVEFIQVPREFEVIYYGGHESNSVDTFKVESDSGFGIVVMNPYRGSDMARKEVRDYVHWVIASHRHELSEVNSRITGNAEGCLVGISPTYEVEPVSVPVLSRPLRMQWVNYISDTSHWLRDKLVEAGLEVEMVEISFQQAVYDRDTRNQADLFIHGEIFELNQTFSYYFFLKNRFSPLKCLLERNEELKRLLNEYDGIPFEKWNDQHLAVEEHLIRDSLCIPLYYVKRRIPFSINIMNIEIKHFGYVDLAKVWMKPSL